MVRLTARVPRGHQSYWEIIRELKRFCVADVDARCNVDHRTIRDYVRRLEKAGFVRRIGVDDRNRAIFDLAKDRPDAPRLRRDGTPAREEGRGQDQMWRAMKMLTAFTPQDIAVHASTPECTVRLETAKQYLKHLFRAGYLKVVRPARPTTGGQAVYRLIPAMNTGPLAPEIQRTDWVWDPNRKAVMGPEGEGR